MGGNFNVDASAVAASECYTQSFLKFFLVEIDGISFIIKISSSSVRFHAKPSLCTNRTNIQCPKRSSDRLVLIVTKLAKLIYANKTKESVTSQKLDSRDF